MADKHKSRGGAKNARQLIRVDDKIYTIEELADMCDVDEKVIRDRITQLFRHRHTLTITDFAPEKLK